MSEGMSRALTRTLESNISPWERCRPASNFNVYSIKRLTQPSATLSGTSFQLSVVEQDIDDWFPSNEHCLELAVVPVVTDRYAAVEGGLMDVGSANALQELFRKLGMPAAVLTCFLDNRIHFNSYPRHSNQNTVHQLSLRQWSIAWSYDSGTSTSKAVLLWAGGSWAKYEIAYHVGDFLTDLIRDPVDHETPGLLGVLLSSRHVADSLAELDDQAFRTERRLRAVSQGDRLQDDTELARLSAAHNWLASRAIREKARALAVSAYIDHMLHFKSSPSPVTGEERARAEARQTNLESLQLLSNSISAQASKICDDSKMHLSTIYNLIAQRDQASNLAIAAASREIALQSKIDQGNSLEIAEATKRIAQEAKRDSSAMKMIAIVTMVYLPGTFVATCFSMGVFEWSAPASEVISPRIWVYILITFALTLLTIGSFLGWLWWQERYSGKTSIEAQNTSESASDSSGKPNAIAALSTALDNARQPPPVRKHVQAVDRSQVGTSDAVEMTNRADEKPSVARSHSEAAATRARPVWPPQTDISPGVERAFSTNTNTTSVHEEIVHPPVVTDQPNYLHKHFVRTTSLRSRSRSVSRNAIYRSTSQSPSPSFSARGFAWHSDTISRSGSRSRSRSLAEPQFAQSYVPELFDLR